MGLGAIFTRDLKITQQNTVTGETVTDVIVSGPGGQYPDWGHGAGPYRGVMAIAAAWRCSILLSDLLGRLPWDLYRSRGAAGQRPDPDEPPEVLATPPLLDRPCPPDTRMVSLSSWGLDALFHGNALGIYADRDRSGYPTAVTPVSAERSWIKRVMRGDGIPLPVGTVAYSFGDRPPELGGPPVSPLSGTPLGRPSDGETYRRWYSPDEVFHVKGPCAPGALRGMGVLECHLAGPLALAATLDDQAAGVGGAGVPTVVIKSLNPDIRPGKAQELKQQAIDSQRHRSPMVINALTEVTPLAWNPSETQLVEARRLSDVAVANIFGCDPSWVGGGASQTYQNIEQRGIDFLRHSAGGWLGRFEQALSLCFPRGQWVEANRDAELQPDTLTRFQVYELAIRNGILTRDEVRALERRRKLTAAQRREVMPAAPAPVSAGTGGSASGADDDSEATGTEDAQGSRQPGRAGRTGAAANARKRGLTSVREEEV